MHSQGGATTELQIRDSGVQTLALIRPLGFCGGLSALKRLAQCSPRAGTMPMSGENLDFRGLLRILLT